MLACAVFVGLLQPAVCKYVDCPRYHVLDRYDDGTELREYNACE